MERSRSNPEVVSAFRCHCNFFLVYVRTVLRVMDEPVGFLGDNRRLKARGITFGVKILFSVMYQI